MTARQVKSDKKADVFKVKKHASHHKKSKKASRKASRKSKRTSRHKR